MIWSSRHFRNHLVLPEYQWLVALTEILTGCLWQPRSLNWWIGIIFAIGAAFFSIPSVFNLSSEFSQAWSLQSETINRIYFAGSIPFTIAAYLQLFPAANVGEFPGHSRSRRRID
ncbi:MAG: hypothetical protein GY768_25045 [Planctomycetaceae bacterium]|nr:hypothetical protein [Planctomycetaceae bacterium]